MFKTMQGPLIIYLIVSKGRELLKQTDQGCTDINSHFYKCVQWLFVSQLWVHVVDYRNPIFCYKDFFSPSCGSENIIDFGFSIPVVSFSV